MKKWGFIEMALAFPDVDGEVLGDVTISVFDHEVELDVEFFVSDKDAAVVKAFLIDVMKGKGCAFTLPKFLDIGDMPQVAKRLVRVSYGVHGRGFIKVSMQAYL